MSERMDKIQIARRRITNPFDAVKVILAQVLVPKHLEFPMPIPSVKVMRFLSSDAFQRLFVLDGRCPFESWFFESFCLICPP